MTIRTAAVWPCNELGEVVMEQGTGTTSVTGYLTQNQIPINESTGKFTVKFPDMTADVMDSPLTGFVSGAGTVGATDTLLAAINKIVGNITLRALSLLTGFVSGAGTVAATDTVVQGISKLDGNVALRATLANPTFTGFVTTQARQLGINEVTAAGTVIVGAADDVILVNKTVGQATPVTIATGTAGRRLTIKDKKGDCFTNNITLTPTAQTIDGAATYVMNVNKSSVTIVFSGTEWSVI